MSKVVEFLAQLGASVEQSDQSYAAAVSRLDVGAELREALARRDASRLPQLLGASEAVCFILLPAENEPQQPEEQPAQDPAREPDQQTESRRVATGR
ncbi:MAG: hypothetical protein AB7E72_18105 [Lysobacterales bacterium]